MSSVRNQVTLIGNTGANPEVKTFGENGKLATLSIATNENYKNHKGERVTETQWHHVVAWGKNAEFVEKNVTKGQSLAVSGRLVNRSYEKDGEKKYVTEVVANEVVLFGSNNSAE